MVLRQQTAPIEHLLPMSTYFIQCMKYVDISSCDALYLGHGTSGEDLLGTIGRFQQAMQQMSAPLEAGARRSCDLTSRIATQLER
jgi:hypothetical protein